MSVKHIKPRMHRRIPLKVALHVTGDFQGEGQILEMSEGGLSFSSAKPAPKGARIRLSISDETAEITVPGVVVHAGERGGESVSGVQFDGIDASTGEAVRAMLKRHRFANFRSPALR